MVNGGKRRLVSTEDSLGPILMRYEVLEQHVKSYFLRPCSDP